MIGVVRGIVGCMDGHCRRIRGLFRMDHCRCEIKMWDVRPVENGF